MDFKRQIDIALEVLMATTNGTFWSQTFGISFGMSGCTNEGKVWAQRKTEVFVSATFDNLAGDMARGHGEHLTALQRCSACRQISSRCVFTKVQERYRELLEHREISPSALIKALDEAVATYPVLAKAETAHWRERVSNCSGGQ